MAANRSYPKQISLRPSPTGGDFVRRFLFLRTQRMRIAVLVNQFPKTSETFIVNQITGLIDRGHTVDIFACYGSEDRIEDPQLRKYGLLDRTRYLSSPTGRRKRVMAAMEATLKRGWKKPLHLLRAINLVPIGNQRISLEMLCRHRFALERSAYDMIHC